MKKFVALLLAVLLMFTFAACGESSNGKIPDGTYTARASEATYGWTDVLTVTYKDGAIVSATFDSEDENGNLKSKASADEYPMDPLPSVWMPQLSENIVKAGTSADVDAVAGATMGSNNAKALLAAIEKGAKDSSTQWPLTVDMPAAE